MHTLVALILAAMPSLQASGPPSLPGGQAAGRPGGLIQVTAPVWKDAPPTMPPGTKIAVLEGDPKQPGMFTIRLKLKAGSIVEPHTHPRPERVTVLSGKVLVGFGDAVDDTKGTTFTAGGFYVNPPNEVHYVVIKEDAVMQLTCEGPWEIKYIQD
jgi:quercetin dioxygenase-like cupin family protein